MVIRRKSGIISVQMREGGNKNQKEEKKEKSKVQGGKERTSIPV
jgi:hypothetical protein